MIRFLLLFLFAPVLVHAQRIDVDVFGGMSNYQGDLQVHFFTFQNAKPAGAVILKIGITEQIFIRTGFSFASLSAYDRDNLPKNQPRNLDFSTGLQEYSAGIEYRILNLERIAFTPYVFVGGGIFHFDPYTYYTYNNRRQRVRLQPLSTEGQGLGDYPDRQPYKLAQFCIPYGAGIKWQINCNLNVGFELRQTKTFTDYIDDVSLTYVDQNKLSAAKGQLAVDLAWREDEYNGKPYPTKDQPRGNPKLGDLYYFAGLTIGLKLNDCESGNFSLGGLFNGAHSLFMRNGSSHKNQRRQLSCPKF